MNNVFIGAVAGAAGTAALDITGYGEMALTGRSPSGTPAEVIRRVAKRANIEPLGRSDAVADDATKNRRSALGAISGYLIGTSIGAVYGAVSPLVARLPVLPKALLVGALAMAASEGPATALAATDPRRWGVRGWLSDIVPHAIYGLVTVAIVDAIRSDGSVNGSSPAAANEFVVAEVIAEEVII